MSNINPQNTSQQIAQRFQKAHAHYAQAAIVQRQMCQQLIQMLRQNAPNQFACALEIGCGSGTLTQEFLAYYQPKRLYLNDLYPEIRHNTLSTSAVCEYLIEDIRTARLPQSLDIVLSASALQWIYPLDVVIQKIHHSLSAQGVLAMATFTQGNLQQIKTLTGQGLTYYTPDALSAVLERCGFQVQAVDAYEQTLYFEQAYAVLKHLQATGVTGANASFRWTKQRLAQFSAAYQQLATAQGVPLTYCPFLVIARKI